MYRDLVFFDMDVYGTPSHPPLTDSMLTRTPLDTSTPKAQSLTAHCSLLRYLEKGWRPELGLVTTPH